VYLIPRGDGDMKPGGEVVQRSAVLANLSLFFISARHATETSHPTTVPNFSAYFPTCPLPQPENNG
jgi:hypothetical protein